MGKQAPRKVVFIDRKFQTSFILKFIALLIAGTAVFDVAAYFVLNRTLGDTFYSAHKAIETVGDMLLPNLIMLSVVFIVVLGLAVLAMTLIVSHLIAGPLYAIRRYIDYISEGRLDFDAKLRSKDQTTPLAVSLSRSLDTLNEHISSQQAISADILSTSEKIHRHLDDEGKELNREDLSREAELLVELGRKLRDETGFFRTRSTADQP